VFFFQAEDGIRDFHVTGVQTCALPICVGGGTGDGLYEPRPTVAEGGVGELGELLVVGQTSGQGLLGLPLPVTVAEGEAGELLGRSEERRVGKECESRGKLAERASNDTK